jgi:hypothetical protein
MSDVLKYYLYSQSNIPITKTIVAYDIRMSDCQCPNPDLQRLYAVQPQE